MYVVIYEDNRLYSTIVFRELNDAITYLHGRQFPDSFKILSSEYVHDTKPIDVGYLSWVHAIVYDCKDETDAKTFNLIIQYVEVVG